MNPFSGQGIAKIVSYHRIEIKLFNPWDRFRNAIKKRPSQIPQEIIRSKTILKNTLVEHLVLLIRNIERYDELIKQVISEIPDGDIFKCLPGADYVLGAKILVLYASKDFCSANDAQVFYGTVPYTVNSGKAHSVRFRMGCSRFGRNALQQQQLRDGSLDTQFSRLEAYIKFRTSPQEDWRIQEIYREEGRSGKDMQRPELQRMMSDVRARIINVVLTTKLDRITRSLLDFHSLHQEFQNYGVEFITLDESFHTSTPTGKAMLNISLVFAELERERTSERTREKMQWQRHSRGYGTAARYWNTIAWMAD